MLITVGYNLDIWYQKTLKPAVLGSPQPVPSPPHVHPPPRDDGSPPPRGEPSPSDGSPPGGGEPYTTPDQPILVQPNQKFSSAPSVPVISY